MSSEGKKHAKKSAVVHYLDESYQELKKVTWPTRNRAVRLTFLVLGVCLVAAVIIGALDFIFGTGHRFLLDLSPARPVPVASDVTTTTGQEIPVAPSEDVPLEPVNITAESASGEPVSVTTVDSGPVTVGVPAAGEPVPASEAGGNP